MLKRYLLILATMFFALCAVPQAIWFMSGIAFAQVDTAWVRRYNGQGNSSDEAHAIAVDGSGNVYVTGESYGSGTNYDYATIKYHANGDTAWVRRFNGPGNDSDKATAIAVDGSGNVYVTGYSTGSGTRYDYATIKYYSNGDTAWVRRYNGPGNLYDYAYGIAVDSLGNNVYVTGYSIGSGTNYDYATIEYHANGDTAWVRRYNGPGNSYDYAHAIAVDGSGNVYVTGESYGSGTDYDYATIKYHANGDTAWVRRYNGQGNNLDRARAIAVDGSRNVYVTGESYDSVTGANYATIKYYSNGDTAWVRRYNGPGNDWDEAYAIAVDGSGNVYVTGNSYGSGTDLDYATIKYLANGDTAWVRRYNGPGNVGDVAYAIAVDGSGNVYVTGSSIGSGTDYATIKYYPNGETAWVRRYNGPGNYTDEASAIAVDGSRNVYVTGTSYGSGTYSDYGTIKYTQYYLTDTLRVFVFSPVDLIVTDPQADSIGIGFNTIPGATYDTTQDYNHDGDKDDIVTLPNRLVGTYQIRVVAEPGGKGTYDLGIRIDGGSAAMLAMNLTCPGPGEADTFHYIAPQFMSGDANGDWIVDVEDVIYLVNYLFKGRPAPNPLERGDATCDGIVDSGDVAFLINYLFKRGSAPSC
ncbi:MAG: SBBP repeat-containing protein [Candidatus Zixiibacteriota bacterium]